MITGIVILLVTLWALPMVCSGCSRMAAWGRDQLVESWNRLFGKKKGD